MSALKLDEEFNCQRSLYLLSSCQPVDGKKYATCWGAEELSEAAAAAAAADAASSGLGRGTIAYIHAYIYRHIHTNIQTHVATSIRGMLAFVKDRLPFLIYSQELNTLCSSTKPLATKGFTERGTISRLLKWASYNLALS